MEQQVEEKKEHQYKEAFCLMWYVSNGFQVPGIFGPPRKNIIRIWNSRNGVTPFIVYFNGLEYQHEWWQLDEPKPDYKLKHGDLFFRDATFEECEGFAKRRLEKCKGTQFEIPEGTEQYKEMYESLLLHFKNDSAPIVDIFK